MIICKPNFFLLTGGPGVGKTTLIEHLRARGERCVEETHRRVIREQVASGGPAVPWLDRQAYGERTAREDIDIFDSLADVQEPVFFDRGIPDTGGPGYAPPAWHARALRTRRYNRRCSCRRPGGRSTPRTPSASRPSRSAWRRTSSS